MNRRGFLKGAVGAAAGGAAGAVVAKPVVEKAWAGVDAMWPRDRVAEALDRVVNPPVTPVGTVVPKQMTTEELKRYFANRKRSIRQTWIEEDPFKQFEGEAREAWLRGTALDK